MRLKQVLQATVLLCGLAVGIAPDEGHADCDAPATLDDAQLMDLRARAASVPYHSGLLWQVEKDGVTSYVFGTMHLYTPRHDRSLERLKPLIEEVEQVFVEFDKADMSAFERRLTSDATLITITDGPSLLDRLGPVAWERLKTALEPYQIPGFMAAKMQPWFLGFTMMMPRCAIDDLQAGRVGIDKMIEETAVAADKPVSSLDKEQDMLDRLAGDPLDQQVDDMRWSLMLDLPTAYGMGGLSDFYFGEEIQLIWENAQVELDRISVGLSDQDAARLRGLFDEMMGDLIAGRNHLWAPTLIDGLAVRSSLVAVGAMHLPGEEGVLRLLEEAGFTITALSMSQP